MNDKSKKLPSSDVGTVVLHWITAIAMFVSLFTGLAIAADWHTSKFEKWLLPILPGGEVWSIHFYAGLTMFFAVTAYVIYMVRAGLMRRISLSKVKGLTADAPKKYKWEALNVSLHWLVYVLILIMTVTGVFLYLGYGGIFVTIHNWSTMAIIVYIFGHVIGHYGFGGWRQLIRILNPADLAANKSTKSLAFFVAAIIGLPVMGAVAALDIYNKDVLTVSTVKDLPTLDGELNDPVWKNAKKVSIFTAQGTGLNGKGESTVEVQAVKDDKNIYFAFRWEDPSHSLRRVPMIKKEDGWHVADPLTAKIDVIDFYEDKFSVLFSHTPDIGGAGATHLGKDHLKGKPEPKNERGFHYTTDGSIKDIWQWKASRSGGLYTDDLYFGPPLEPTPAEAEGKARYQAGYANDPGKAFYSYNYSGIKKGTTGPFKPQWLPKDLQATLAKVGKIDLIPDSNDDENAQWFLYDNETEPYTTEADAKIPVGTIIPSLLIKGAYEGDRAHVQSRAKWKDGHWILETVRALDTKSVYDMAFVKNKDIYFWVGVFDHTQTRHTRHARPVKIDLK